MAVGTSPAHDAVAIRRLQSGCRIGPERVAGIGAANVGPNRTGKTLGILFAITEIVFAAEFGTIFFGRQNQGSSTFPAAHKLCSKTLARGRLALPVRIARRGIQEVPELGHILGQLSKHKIGPVAAQVVHTYSRI